MSDSLSGSDRMRDLSPEEIAALARQGAVLARGLAEPLATTIAACREILAYVNRHALMAEGEDDPAREVASLNALLDEAFTKLSTAVQQAEDAAVVRERAPGDG